MEEGLILTTEQIQYIIDCIPDLSFERIRDEHFLDIYDAFYEKEFHFIFESTYQIKLPELMHKIRYHIYQSGKTAGHYEKASEIRKALNIES